MGDAGSTLIGFTVIWLLLETTQGKTHSISPVTALWIIAIPLMDMVAIMYRRLRKGMSPFSLIANIFIIWLCEQGLLPAGHLFLLRSQRRFWRE